MQINPNPTRLAHLRAKTKAASDAYDAAQIGTPEWHRARRWLHMWVKARLREERRPDRDRTLEYCGIALTALIRKAAVQGLDERDMRRAGLVLNAAVSAGEVLP